MEIFIKIDLYYQLSEIKYNSLDILLVAKFIVNALPKIIFKVKSLDQ